jgi:hypothetical protein
VKIRAAVSVVGLVGAVALDYFIFSPRWWPIAAWGSLGALLCPWIAAIVRPPRGITRRRPALLILAAISSIALIGWLRPVAHLRLAMSADALAHAVLSGNQDFSVPVRIGLFDVKRVRIRDDGVAVFGCDEPDSGAPRDWDHDLRAKITQGNGGAVRLSDWTWLVWKGLSIR